MTLRRAAWPQLAGRPVRYLRRSVIEGILYRVRGGGEAARKAAGPEEEPRMQLFISYAHLNEKELIPSARISRT